MLFSSLYVRILHLFVGDCAHTSLAFIFLMWTDSHKSPHFFDFPCDFSAAIESSFLYLCIARCYASCWCECSECQVLDGRTRECEREWLLSFRMVFSMHRTVKLPSAPSHFPAKNKRQTHACTEINNKRKQPNWPFFAFSYDRAWREGKLPHNTTILATAQYITRDSCVARYSRPPVTVPHAACSLSPGRVLRNYIIPDTYAVFSLEPQCFSTQETRLFGWRSGNDVCYVLPLSCLS